MIIINNKALVAAAAEVKEEEVMVAEAKEEEVMVEEAKEEEVMAAAAAVDF